MWGGLPLRLAQRRPCLAAPPRNARFWFGGGKVRNKKKKNQEETQGVWGKGGERLFCTFFCPWLCESLLSFINGSGSWKPSVWRETTGEVGSKGSKKAPKGDGGGKPECAVPLSHSRLLCRGECGTAELARGRRGVAVFEQGSGAITFFSSSVSSKHSSPPSRLSLHPTSLSFNPAHVFLFKGCSADEYDWHLQPPLDFQLKPLEWRRSWAAKGRAVFFFGFAGGMAQLWIYAASAQDFSLWIGARIVETMLGRGLFSESIMKLCN